MVAIIKSKWAKFGDTPPRPQSAGAVHTAEFIIDVSAGLLAVDKVDLGILMGGAKIVDATLYADVSLGVANLSVGIMSGDVGSSDTARTVGTELYNAQAAAALHTTPVKLGNPAALLLAASNVDRSIGLVTSADIVAGAGKVIRLILFYAQ